MSKSIGKVFGNSSVNDYGYERDYVDYLKNYNTGNYDNTQSNMTATALNMSQNLGNMPEYKFNVDYSDDARRQAEEATFNSYAAKVVPQYQQQTADLHTSLINQGIPVGSEAYQRAMSGLQSSQNAALNQAAYQSVLNGQNAYSQSLADSINAAQFNNTAQQNYIAQIQSLLNGAVSGYDNMANLYNAQQGIEARKTNANQSGWNNLFKTVDTVTNTAKSLF
ncbi:MAG: hypothetical protein IKN71_02465 [Alphaproteobacteria bacterium]|nr:hypothetical protein [Alphaproteobacteria bacterium]